MLMLMGFNSLYITKRIVAKKIQFTPLDTTRSASGHSPLLLGYEVAYFYIILMNYSSHFMKKSILSWVAFCLLCLLLAIFVYVVLSSTTLDDLSQACKEIFGFP